jgi:superfamily II DNA or RNA helicase
VKSFQDVFQALPEASGERGKKFEHLSKWWLLQDPIWSSRIAKVWLWDEWPDRTNKDTGIDIVAETVDGDLWAVQCKCYDPESQLNKRDVDSFLSESSRKTFKLRVLISTTKEIGPNLRKSLEHQEKQVLIVDWNALVDSQVDWSKYGSKKSPDLRITKTLRDHQKLALERVIAGFDQHNRGQLIMACGTGKTLTGLRIKEAMRPKLTLVLVPSLTLLSQILKDWLTDRNEEFKWLAVCSDDSVSKDSEDNARLIDYSFPTTTNPLDIEKFLATAQNKVIFSTYQSSRNVAKALARTGTRVDLLLADEAHRLAGNTNPDFATFLSDKNAPVSKRLFLTATPRVFSSATKASSEAQGHELVSMDDPNIFGDIFFKFSFGEAIRAKMLTDYRVVVLGVEERQIEELISERALVAIEDTHTDALSLATHVALELAMKEWGLRRVISFHSRISRAKSFAALQLKVHEWLPPELSSNRMLQVETVTSGQPTSSRRRILEKFSTLKDDQALLVTNARCLTEGVDVPNLDGVVFADPRSSKIDIVQAVGRAIRLGEKTKTHGTIVLPVVISQNSESSLELEKSNFSIIWGVLNALQSHDESLVEELASLRRNLGKLKSVGDLPSRIHLELPTTVSKAFAEKIKLMIVDRSTDSWEERFGELTAFQKANGHTRVKQSQGRNSDKDSLGIWVAKQRSDYKKGILDVGKVRAFEVFSDWTWDPIEADWANNLDALESAAKEFGGLQNIPRDFEDSFGNKVGQWFTSVRSRAASGKLEPGRLKQIDARFQNWQWDARSDQWEAGFQAAKKWLAENHDAPGPSVTIPGIGTRLDNWIKVNKKAYLSGKTTSIFTRERLKKLETLTGWLAWAKESQRLGLFPDAKSAVQVRALETYLEGLGLYRNEFGNIAHPISVNRAPFVYKGHALGQAANRYRTQFKNGTLPEWVKKNLESVEGWIWDALDDAWEANFKALEAYVRANGTASVSQGETFNGLALGTWVARQRRIKKGHAAGKLTAEQVERLEALPVWLWDASKSRRTDARDLAWREKYELLKTYAKRNGSADPSATEQIDGVFIGRWVAVQRGIKKGTNTAGKLTNEEIELLEKLPGWKW